MANADPTLNEDRPCVQCTYNLRGQPLTSVCPECGLSVANSLRGFQLQYASETYKRTIVSGLSLTLNGIYLFIVVLIIIGVAILLGSVSQGIVEIAIQMIASIAFTAAMAMILVGNWRFTKPDPGFTGVESPASARMIVRISALVQAVSSALWLIIMLNLITLAPRALAPTQKSVAVGLDFFGLIPFAALSVLLVLAALVAGFFGMMLYTKWLASRIPDAHLVHRSKTYLWLLPVVAIAGYLVIVGPFIALALYVNHLNRFRKHAKSILATGAPAKLPNMLG